MFEARRWIETTIAFYTGNKKENKLEKNSQFRFNYILVAIIMDLGVC
jgi:hypothetical protein